LIVGIVVENKSRPISGFGRQKIRSGSVRLPHAPDAGSAQYRNESTARKNISARFCVLVRLPRSERISDVAKGRRSVLRG
jgi:hypothetical protein